LNRQLKLENWATRPIATAAQQRHAPVMHIKRTGRAVMRALVGKAAQLAFTVPPPCIGSMTKQNNPFPIYEKAQEEPLARESVVNYLLRINAQGQVVQVDGDAFVLPIDTGEVRITPTDGLWRVSKTSNRVLNTYGDVSTEVELDRLLRLTVGAPEEWPAMPRRGRLSAKTPASNYATISSLIGGGQVQAVFDPYLDNQGLENLTRILSFGQGSALNGVRLLGSSATLVGGAGKPPRFTKAGVAAWAAQLGIQAEARVLTQKGEHRRFLLLDGGRPLILGPSLNSLHKNEAVAIEDDKEDRPFFDTQWSQAALLQ
jgi:hypothetical protein